MHANHTYRASAGDPTALPVLSSPGARSTLYLATADATVKSAVARSAASLGLQLSSFSTVHEFTQKYEYDRPSSLVIDSRLTTLRCDQFERELKRLGGASPIILLLDRPDTQATVRAVKAGAVAVLEKPLIEDSLREAILQAINESTTNQSKTKEARDFQQRLAGLSSGQRAVLDLVLDGLANKSIARILAISIRTVEMRRSRVYKCLNVDSVAQLVRRCIAANYIKP